MKPMHLNLLNQKMLLIDGMNSLVLVHIQILILERGYQIQTGLYLLTVREVFVMVTMK